MTDQEFISEYNYDSFIPEKCIRWLNFEYSPPIGEPAPDFPLWRLEDRQEMRLSAIWGANALTVVEFGSLT